MGALNCRGRCGNRQIEKSRCSKWKI